VLRLRFKPDDGEEVDIEFLKSIEEQIRTHMKVGPCQHSTAPQPRHAQSCLSDGNADLCC
jgi:hypothetical protein